MRDSFPEGADIEPPKVFFGLEGGFRILKGKDTRRG
jgi:hypothetical protein